MNRRIVAASACSLCLALPAFAKRTPQPSGYTPIAISNDGKLLVNVNPDSDSVTVFKVGKKGLTSQGQITVGDEPRSVTIASNDRTAFVANALDGTVSVVDLKKKRVTDTIAVGAEPYALALSPRGKMLYVANSSSNDVSVIDTKMKTVAATVDLSSFGTAPRSIAVTNDGDKDDTDETIFVAMFFGQLRAGKSSLDEGQDDQREGRVVAISAATNLPLTDPIRLGPLADTGFPSNGKLAPGPGNVPAAAATNPPTFMTTTGCFPNQLASVAIRPGTSHAYVVSTGASPNGPVRFNVNMQGLVSVFDTATRMEITAAQTDAQVRRTAPLNLNQGIDLSTSPAPKLFLTNPVAMAWRPDGMDAWIAIQQSDLVVRLTVDEQGVPTIGAPLIAGPSQIVRVDLQAPTGGATVAEVPRGLVIDPKGRKLYVSNFVSRTVTTIDITDGAAPAILATNESSALPAAGTSEADVLKGAALFYTGRGPGGRMARDAWGSCALCHPDGLTDNVTWMFDAGPRQTIPLDGTFAKGGALDQRMLNWSAVRDENHDFELNTRGVSGGQGLVDDDRIFYTFGGATDTTPADSAAVESFQNFTGVASTTNDLFGGATLPTLTGSTPRRDFGSATLPDGRFYIIGGRSGTGQGSLVTGADTVLEFNPRTNTVTRRGSTGFTPRHSLGAAAVRTSGGVRIYAVGGYADTMSSTLPSTMAQEYDPATDIWRTVASLPTRIAQFGIAVAGGINTAEPRQLIHVVGGTDGTEANPFLFSVGVVQRFQADPTGPGTWSNFTVPTGFTPRRNHGCATVLRGTSSRILVIGGQNAAGQTVSTVEEYIASGVSPVVTAHTALPSPRSRFGIAGTTSTNQIYVIGGLDDMGAPQPTIFEYSVATNGPVAGPVGTPSGAWATRGNLAAPRFGCQVSTPPGVTNFLPAPNAGRSTDLDALNSWVELNVRSARASNRLDAAAVSAGRTHFGQDGLVVSGFSCATCHGGRKWTRSTVDYVAPPSPEVGIGFGNERVIGAELRQTMTQGNSVLSNVGTFTSSGRTNEIRFNAADAAQAVNPLGANGFNIPSLLSVDQSAPYFYNGIAPTLPNVLDGSQDGNGGTRHHFVTDATMRAQLVEFLRSIDPTTPIFP